MTLTCQGPHISSQVSSYGQLALQNPTSFYSSVHNLPYKAPEDACPWRNTHGLGSGMVVKGAREGLSGPMGPGPGKLIPGVGLAYMRPPPACVAHHSTDSLHWQCPRSRQVCSQGVLLQGTETPFLKHGRARQTVPRLGASEMAFSHYF